MASLKKKNMSPSTIFSNLLAFKSNSSIRLIAGCSWVKKKFGFVFVKRYENRLANLANSPGNLTLILQKFLGKPFFPYIKIT